MKYKIAEHFAHSCSFKKTRDCLARLVKGGVNKVIYLKFFDKLCMNLKMLHDEDFEQIVNLQDNARIHKSSEFSLLATLHHETIVYAPPYSSILPPVELVIGMVRQKLKW